MTSLPSHLHLKMGTFFLLSEIIFSGTKLLSEKKGVELIIVAAKRSMECTIIRRPSSTLSAGELIPTTNIYLTCEQRGTSVHFLDLSGDCPGRYVMYVLRSFLHHLLAHYTV